MLNLFYCIVTPVCVGLFVLSSSALANELKSPHTAFYSQSTSDMNTNKGQGWGLVESRMGEYYTYSGDLEDGWTAPISLGKDESALLVYSVQDETVAFAEGLEWDIREIRALIEWDQDGDEILDRLEVYWVNLQPNDNIGYHRDGSLDLDAFGVLLYLEDETDVATFQSEQSYEYALRSDDATSLFGLLVINTGDSEVEYSLPQHVEFNDGTLSLTPYVSE